MSNSRLVITVDFDIPSERYSATSIEWLRVERILQSRGLIFRGLKRTVNAFNCLQEQEKTVDPRVFNLDMNFSDISFAVEHHLSGVWNRTDIVFSKTFEEDGYEIS